MSTLGSPEALNRNASAFDKFLFWDPTGGTLVPALAKAWEQSDDARSVTLYLREGLKWSDGHPLTTEDVRFWYEDVYRNTEIQPEPEPGPHPQRRARPPGHHRRLPAALGVRRAVLDLPRADGLSVLARSAAVSPWDSGFPADRWPRPTT